MNLFFLEKLYLNAVEISSLYLSNNTLLKQLDINSVPLYTIYLPEFEVIEQFSIGHTNLYNIDFTSYSNVINHFSAIENEGLQEIIINADTVLHIELESNGLQAVQINCDYSEILEIGGNFLDSINFNDFYDAKQVIIVNNNLSSTIDLSSFESLTYLDLRNNNITQLSLNENKSNLYYLDISDNNINYLSLTDYDSLAFINLHNNQLTQLNLSGLNYLNIQDFDATLNNLSCIQVDNIPWYVANITAQHGEIDPYVYFDNSCYEIFGCTNPNASNYNSNASTDDNSCQNISGCTDEIAQNYNPEAEIDNGSCTYVDISLISLNKTVKCGYQHPTGFVPLYSGDTIFIVDTLYYIEWEYTVYNSGTDPIDSYKFFYSIWSGNFTYSSFDLLPGEYRNHLFRQYNKSSIDFYLDSCFVKVDFDNEYDLSNN